MLDSVIDYIFPSPIIYDSVQVLRGNHVCHGGCGYISMQRMRYVYGFREMLAIVPYSGKVWRALNWANWLSINIIIDLGISEI